MIYFDILAVSVISIFVGVLCNLFEIRKTKTSKCKKKCSSKNQLQISHEYAEEPVIIQVLDDVYES